MMDSVTNNGPAIRISPAKAVFVLALAAVCALLAMSAVATQSASADPAICDQYASIPQCDQATGGGGTENPVGSGTDASAPGGIPGTAGPSADLAGGASGELPFTGYPLTPLVLILLLLLIAGLTARAGVAIRDRLAAGRPGT
jgi:hypothetical protein